MLNNEVSTDPFTVKQLLYLVSKCWVSELPTPEPIVISTGLLGRNASQALRMWLIGQVGYLTVGRASSRGTTGHQPIQMPWHTSQTEIAATCNPSPTWTHKHTHIILLHKALLYPEHMAQSSTHTGHFSVIITLADGLLMWNALWCADVRAFLLKTQTLCQLEQIHQLLELNFLKT